jgi:selenocysteine-specific elongation factor
MHVIATAGHVDHGKSTLVRALTGMEPDRWAEERRRGMTIDLGYAWTTLPSGAELAFVDVPGHQRFVTNMLAGVGPVPVAMIVIAADEGWRAQTEEHVAALTALDLRHGLVVVTRSDLADPAPAMHDALERLAGTSLARVEAVAVSGHTGAGLPELAAALDRLVASLPAPDRQARVRLWVDRAFTIRGRGTVVTATLAAGTVRAGDVLELDGRRLGVRGVQALGRPATEVGAVARVAVNLRGIGAEEISRGDPLLTPSAWHRTDTVDVAMTAEPVAGEFTLHVGSASLPVRVRPLDARHARLVLPRPLPLSRDDRAILRDPGRHEIVAGVVVLDADPPAFSRRGAARARGQALAGGQAGRLVEEVRRRGAVTRRRLELVGIHTATLDGTAAPEDKEAQADTAAQADTDRGEVRVIGPWLVAPDVWLQWVAALPHLVDAAAAADPRRPGLPVAAAASRLGLPDPDLAVTVAAQAGLTVEDGRIARPGAVAALGAAEAAFRTIEDRWRQNPFAAPAQPDLDELGIGRRDVATAEKLGRILRLDDVMLPPDAAERAVERLSALAQPFTVSQARQALDTTRRVALPLLAHLDRTGRTERIDDQARRVV